MGCRGAGGRNSAASLFLSFLTGCWPQMVLLLFCCECFLGFLESPVLVFDFAVVGGGEVSVFSFMVMVE